MSGDRASPTGRDAARRRRSEPTGDIDTGTRFLRVGNKLYRNSDDKKPVVKLQPGTLITRDTDALPDIMRIAKFNGWSHVEIRGSAAFKKHAYLAAAKQGITVTGYRATQLVEAEAQRYREAARRSEARTTANPRTAAQSRNASERPGDGAALAARFLKQSDAANARDPDLKAAQSLIALASTRARAAFPGDPTRIAAAIAARRSEVAERIARGEKISGIAVRTSPAGERDARTRPTTHQRPRTR